MNMIRFWFISLIIADHIVLKGMACNQRAISLVWLAVHSGMFGEAQSCRVTPSTSGMLFCCARGCVCVCVCQPLDQGFTATNFLLSPPFSTLKEISTSRGV